MRPCLEDAPGFQHVDSQWGPGNPPGAESSSADHLAVSLLPALLTLPPPQPTPLPSEEDRGSLFAAGELFAIGRELLTFYVPDISPCPVGIAVWTTFPCP